MLKRLSNENDFLDIIKTGTWLVDFSATWCGPCRMLEPVLEELSEKYNILTVDVDKCSNLSVEYDIMSVPSLLLFKNGKQERMTVGYMSVEEVEYFINN